MGGLAGIQNVPKGRAGVVQEGGQQYAHPTLIEPVRLYVGGEAICKAKFGWVPPHKVDDCMGAIGRAMQEQLPSLHAAKEHFLGNFNTVRVSKVIFRGSFSV